MNDSVLYFALGACIGVIISSTLSLILLRFLAQKAQKDFPDFRIDVPEGAEQSDIFQQWAKKHGYQFNADLNAYVKGKGFLTSKTLLRFSAGQMQCLEVVVHLFAKESRFALNAPVFLGKPVRKHKVKALNELLAQWQLPPITF